MAIAAIVNKGRLKRRFDPGYFCKVNVASELALVFRFKVKFLDFVSVDHHNAGFLRVGGVDEHLLCHVFLPAPSERPLSRAGDRQRCG